jgi:aryl-alcohol dehydrogenase-like predicted oxidoreductase
MAQTYGIAVIPWSPTAGGFLTGKYSRNAPVPADSRFDEFWKGLEQRHFSDAAYAILDLLVQLSREKVVHHNLRWHGALNSLASPVRSSTKTATLDDSLNALNILLTTEDLGAKIASHRPTRHRSVLVMTAWRG